MSIVDSFYVTKQLTKDGISNLAIGWLWRSVTLRQCLTLKSMCVTLAMSAGIKIHFATSSICFQGKQKSKELTMYRNGRWLSPRMISESKNKIQLTKETFETIMCKTVHVLTFAGKNHEAIYKKKHHIREYNLSCFIWIGDSTIVNIIGEISSHIYCIYRIFGIYCIYRLYRIYIVYIEYAFIYSSVA